MHRKPLALVAAVAVLFGARSASAAAQQTFYVSPSGSDDNPGTEASPFQHVERAREAVRLINSNMSGDILVYLRAGRYELGSTLSFTPSDAGPTDSTSSTRRTLASERG